MVPDIRREREQDRREDPEARDAVRLHDEPGEELMSGGLRTRRARRGRRIAGHLRLDQAAEARRQRTHAAILDPE